MTFIRTDKNGKDYIARRVMGGASNRGRHGCHPHRNWWLVKWRSQKRGNKLSESGYISLSGMLTLPKKYVGKKIRFLVEIIEDKE